MNDGVTYTPKDWWNAREPYRRMWELEELPFY